MTTIELHPLCTLFPRMAEAEFWALVADIKANGLRHPIVLHDGMILDGGNRYRACAAADVIPVYENFAGDSIVAYVLSANLHRRHLSPGQQAAIVASAQDWAMAQMAGKPVSGKIAGLHRVEDRAAQSGASERTQRMADMVAKTHPELAKQVARGETSLPAAIEQITGKRPGAKTPVPAANTDAEPSADEIAEDAYGDLDMAELLAQQSLEIEELTALVNAIQADDPKAEAMKWRKAYDAAVRSQSEAMDRAHKSVEREKVTKRQLMRCGKAVGEDDEFKIAPAVEAMARSFRGTKVAA